jgi:transposase InsO family protein
MVVDRITTGKSEHGLDYQAQCRAGELAYSSFMRWKSRWLTGRPVIETPGPKKVEKPNLGQLEEEIRQLAHGSKRTHGTGALWDRHRSRISRRQFQQRVDRARRKMNQDRQAQLRIVTWLRPGLVWSMDDTEFDSRCNGTTVHFHGVQDLASRYKFQPLVGDRLAPGEKVAVHLKALFARHGPPLILKRDNHSNLNHSAVDALLEEEVVIPLNNPPYYAPYNGGMEKAQGEIQKALQQRMDLAESPSAETVSGWVEAVVHDLNHRPRHCLGGLTSCERFGQARQETRPYDRRRRKEVFDWIKALAARILANGERVGRMDAATAWRIAVRTWLQRHGVITIATRKSVTPFSNLFVS